MTLVLLTAVFAVNIYRAATQGITVDEAFTYQHFVAPPFAKVMTSYDVNHHVLNSLLGKVTTNLFGLSELTVRMPALLGGLIYLIAARAIVLYVFSAEWALAAFALLSLNPFVLDYLSAARGYGLALGCLAAALWFLLRGKWYGAGICFGLTAGANLSFLYPIAGLLAMAVVADTTKKTFGSFLERVVVPLVVFPFVLYVVPLSRANPQQFAFTSPTLYASFRGFVDLTFTRRKLPLALWMVHGAEILGLLVLVGSAVACIWILRSTPSDTLSKPPRAKLDHLILLNGGGALVCLAITWLAHVMLNAGYPYTRTGVYWPVILTLAGVALADRFAGLRILRWASFGLAILFVSAFLFEFQVGQYQEWKFDAGSKRIAEFILARGGRGSLRIACTGMLAHGLTFYNTTYHARWEIIPDTEAPGDFHVFLPADFRPDLKLLYKDPVSNAVVMQ